MVCTLGSENTLAHAFFIFTRNHTYTTIVYYGKLGRSIPGERKHGYLVVVFLDASAIRNGWTMEMSSHYSTSLRDNTSLFAVAIAYASKCVCKYTNSFL